MITGQVILREAGTTYDGRKLYTISGVIASEKDTDIKGEHQYTVLGNESNNIYLTICKSEPKDMRGITPVWKI